MSDEPNVVSHERYCAAEWNDDVFCERAVLGRMIEFPATIPDALFILGADDFLHPLRRSMFETIAKLHAAGSPIETNSVGRGVHAERGGIVGEIYAEIIACKGDVSSQTNMDYYAKGI